MRCVCVEFYAPLNWCVGTKFTVSGVDAPIDYVFIFDEIGEKYTITLLDFLNHFELVFSDEEEEG